MTCSSRSTRGRWRVAPLHADEGDASMGMAGAPPKRGSGRGSARMRRPRHGTAEARRRVVLADLGAAVGGRTTRLRRVQQVERHRRDRRRARGSCVRRIPAGDGRLQPRRHARRTRAARHEQARSVRLDHRPRDGKELARIPTQRKVVHGVAISDDDRYAFISVEGIGLGAGNGGGDRPGDAADGRERRRRAAGRRHRLLAKRSRGAIVEWRFSLGAQAMSDYRARSFRCPERCAIASRTNAAKSRCDSRRASRSL